MELELIYPKFKEKPLIPTKTAANELDDLNIDLDDVVQLLEEGFDCSRSKRAANIIEKCIQKGNKIIKIVVADIGSYWKLIHAGRFIVSKEVKDDRM